MKRMVVTLDVSKLSGWLNANAYCRVERKAYDAGRGVGGEVGGHVLAAAQAACTGKARLKAVGVRARAERTSNMLSMSFTLDVSKLSGRLKNFASCRVASRAYDAGRGAGGEVGGHVSAAAQAACTGKARLKAVGVRARAERTLNMLLMSFTLDVSKLSGWLNAFAPCRVARRAYDAG
eukprot:scaffold57029_cov52-Phaeocystis_antarctica.AAC.2